jgi:uncharacterized protein YjiS (DUF1127 family)
MRRTNTIDRQKSLLFRIFSTVSQLATRIWQRRKLMSLLDMPDYLLKDIGLQRHEITREGLKWFWED